MQNIPVSWQDSLSVTTTYTLSQFAVFLPRFVGAIVILLIGMLVASLVRKLIIKTMQAMKVSRAVEKTPLELFLKDPEFGQKLEGIIGGLFYWLFLFVVIYTAVFVLGLTPLLEVMDKILEYIPHIFSAFFIFFFGVLLAGVVESFIKGSMRSFDVYTARLFAKVASYMVVIVAVLAAVAELGIASEFIRILFFGVIFAFALGGGLALGLGGQHTVKKMLEDWYKRTKSE